jgi:hypothetical protein
MILESSKIKKLEFIFNEKKEIIVGNIREILRKLSNFCYEKGFKFQTLSEEEVNDKILKTTLTQSSFHKLPNGEYIGGFDNANVAYIKGIANKWLGSIGDINNISLSDFSSIDSSDDLEIETEDNEPITPMRSLMLQDFWTKFKSEISNVTNLYARRAATSKEPWFAAATGISAVGFICVVSSRYARVELYISKSSKEDNKSIFDYLLGKEDELESSFGEKLIFERLDSKKASRIKFEISSNVYDKNNWNSIMNFFKVYLPKFESAFQPVIDEIKNNPSVLNFKSDKVQDSTEDNEEVEILEDYVKNPFGCKQEDGTETSAICILGESGAGKSYRVRKTLQNSEHKYVIVSPTSATTNLLVQYDRGDYVLSTLGEFIKRAVEDPNSYYTAILDEGHKYIKMIDDELLQCLSSKRNDGVRFISFDNPIFKRLYDFLETDDDFGGVGLIPDNLGFILISSKRDAILNADIRNRISVINLDKSHQDIEFAIDKLKELIEDSEDDGYSNE